MPASEETGSGPVIHDHRRIDPVTGQVRGKHAASKPAGTTGAGRPGRARLVRIVGVRLVRVRLVRDRYRFCGGRLRGSFRGG